MAALAPEEQVAPWRATLNAAVTSLGALLGLVIIPGRNIMNIAGAVAKLEEAAVFIQTVCATEETLDAFRKSEEELAPLFQSANLDQSLEDVKAELETKLGEGTKACAQTQRIAGCLAVAGAAVTLYITYRDWSALCTRIDEIRAACRGEDGRPDDVPWLNTVNFTQAKLAEWQALSERLINGELRMSCVVDGAG